MDRGATAVTAVGLELRGIHKRYPNAVACRGIDLDCAPGRIHAVVGENGAGKSTLFHIAAGIVQPDAGTVQIGGATLGRGGAARARQLGLGMVHQHFLLVPTLTVADNVVLGREPGPGPWYDRDAARARVRATAAEFGLQLDPDSRVGDLGVGAQQRVEIVRVLDAGARVLVLDEPTAVLTPQEADDLLAILRRLAAGGRAIVLVTHRLPEVLAVADDITVLRDGRVVRSFARGEATQAELAAAIVGRPMAPAPPRNAVRRGEPMLELAAVTTSRGRGTNTDALAGVSFTVHAGEIVGVAGVDGNGQRALLGAILGTVPCTDGRILFAGRDVVSMNVAARRRAGLAYVADDRLQEGVIADFELAENLLLAAPRADAVGWRGWLRRGERRRRAAAELQAGDVRPPVPTLEARALSGGNQQKLVLARELGSTTRILVLGQPTRGVDVGGIEFLHRRIRDARSSGTAVLLVSADLNEILALADRILVLYAGRMHGPFDALEVSASELGRHMTGAGAAS